VGGRPFVEWKEAKEGQEKKRDEQESQSTGQKKEWWRSRSAADLNARV